jgi:hypothetical protein
MLHVWVTEEAYRGFCLGDLRERVHLSDLGVEGMSKTDLQELEWEGTDCSDKVQDRDR